MKEIIRKLIQMAKQRIMQKIMFIKQPKSVYTIHRLWAWGSLCTNVMIAFVIIAIYKHEIEFVSYGALGVILCCLSGLENISRDDSRASLYRLTHTRTEDIINQNNTEIRLNNLIMDKEEKKIYADSVNRNYTYTILLSLGVVVFACSQATLLAAFVLVPVLITEYIVIFFISRKYGHY